MGVIDTQNNMRITAQVVGAVMLRDIRTRFGSSYKAYVIAILYPFLHLAAVVTAWTIVGRVPPLGTDTVTYFAIVIVPFILYTYTMRRISQAVPQNRPLLFFPRVKVIDIFAARVIVESVTAAVICAFAIVILIVLGFEFEPYDYARMLAGFAGGLYLGIAVGFSWGLICGIWPGALYLTNLLIITLWIASGIFFLPDVLPEKTQYWLSFNPLLHAIELARVGYYPDFHSTILDVSYMFWYPTVLIFLSLLAELIFRKFVMAR